MFRRQSSTKKDKSDPKEKQMDTTGLVSNL